MSFLIGLWRLVIRCGSLGKGVSGLVFLGRGLGGGKRGWWDGVGMVHIMEVRGMVEVRH